MARFPHSYGSIDLSKYPNMQYLNVTLPNGTSSPCIVLPVSEKWIRIYADRNNAMHADLGVVIEDASSLNEYVAAKDRENGRDHTDFHGLIHISMTPDGHSKWVQSLVDELMTLSDYDLNERAKTVRLDRDSIAASQYYRDHPDRIPDRQKIMERIANDVISKKTSAGRIYAPSLSEQKPVPAAAVAAAPVQGPVFAEPDSDLPF